jgi:hypothetical protein
MMEQMDEFGQFHINYSTYTKKFYCSTSLEPYTYDNIYYSTVNQHRDTPEEAIEAFYNTLMNAKCFYICNDILKWQKKYKYINNEFKCIKGEHTLVIPDYFN